MFQLVTIEQGVKRVGIKLNSIVPFSNLIILGSVWVFSYGFKAQY